MSLVIMSETELSRLDSARKIQEKRLSVTRAAKLHGVSRRQVHRRLLRYAADGTAGLVSNALQMWCAVPLSSKLRTFSHSLGQKRPAGC